MAVEPFVSSFLTDGGRTYIARPVGLAVAKDGALLMADNANGVIYRIAYTGKASGSAAAATPDAAMKQQASRGIGVPLALERAETAVARPVPR